MNGRTALVTGSTDGIGVAIARTLAIGGAQVIVSGRNAERGEQVVKSILDPGWRGSTRLERVDGSAFWPSQAELVVSLIAGKPRDLRGRATWVRPRI